MKKTLSIILILITFFVIYFLQINLFNWFNIYGVSPNLFIILVLIIGLFIGKKVGLALGIVLGLYIDVVNGKIFGQTALMLGIVGLLGEYLDKSFSKERATRLEGSFGTQKQHYSLARIKARKRKTEILWIFFGIHTANAILMIDKIRNRTGKAA